MPIPRPTLEQSLAAVRRFETLLATAVAEQQDLKQIYWAAEDLALMADRARFPEARYRAGHALIRALETAEKPENRDAIQQAIAGCEYHYPEGWPRASAKRVRAPAGGTGRDTPAAPTPRSQLN